MSFFNGSKQLITPHPIPTNVSEATLFATEKVNVLPRQIHLPVMHGDSLTHFRMKHQIQDCVFVGYRG
jgi:hypothetical protein